MARTCADNEVIVAKGILRRACNCATNGLTWGCHVTPPLAGVSGLSGPLLLRAACTDGQQFVRAGAAWHSACKSLLTYASVNASMG